MAGIKQHTVDFEGIYESPEAALYLTATLRRDIPDVSLTRHFTSARILAWIRNGLSDPELAAVAGRELLLTFEDLISMRVIGVMRALGVSFPKIHRAEHWLRQQTGYHRPFAVQRIWTETVDVFAQLPEVGMGLIAASRHGQAAFPQMLGEYLWPVQDLTFVPHNGVRVAHTWTPHEDVLIHPEVQFGEPCVLGTAIPTRMLRRMVQGGDSYTYLSRAFKISEPQIDNALRWESRLAAAKTRPISR